MFFAIACQLRSNVLYIFVNLFRKSQTTGSPCFFNSPMRTNSSSKRSMFLRIASSLLVLFIDIFRKNFHDGTSLRIWRDRDREQQGLEARVGIEPTHKGFADLSLTTWVPRPCSIQRPDRSPSAEHELTGDKKIWSGRRDLNPRLRPWQGRTLPLSYSRSTKEIIQHLQGQSSLGIGLPDYDRS